MPQINCPDCNHPMSDQAKVCPHCNAPRIVGNSKNCINCGEQIAANRKKCPKCDAPQYDSVPESKSKSPMATNRKSSVSAWFGGIIIGIAVGAGGLYAYNDMGTQSPTNVTVEEVPEGAATVSRKNGLYVFIDSKPGRATEFVASYNYAQGGKLLDIINTKGENALDEINIITNMLVYDRKIDAITKDIHEQYGDADCVVFNGRLDKCEVYKFKE
jgi:hypothetical protein